MERKQGLGLRRGIALGLALIGTGINAAHADVSLDGIKVTYHGGALIQHVKVAPLLYVAVGISGASQHLGGIHEAETIVAINTDAACPMMARATLAAVGDAAEVVAALTAVLRARQERARERQRRRGRLPGAGCI